MVAVPILAGSCRRTIGPDRGADPCPAERTVRLSWIEQAARDRLTQHDPTVEQQPRLPDLRRSGSYSVPFASASRGFGVLEPRYFDESGCPTRLENRGVARWP